MGLFGKKKITETEIAGLFVLAFTQEIKQHWTEIDKELSNILPGKMSFSENKYASFEFALAVIVVQLQALPNIFPIDQANRIREHVIKYISSPELGSYPSDTINEYQIAWDKALKEAEIPLYNVASLLLDKLQLQSTIEVNNITLKDPLLLMILSEKIIKFGGGWWKTISKKYKIRP